MRTNLIRGSILVTGGLLLIFQFQNCSSYSDNSLYNGMGLNSSLSTTGPNHPSLVIQTARKRVRAHENFFEIGGICDPGTYSMNRIVLRLRQQNSNLAYVTPVAIRYDSSIGADKDDTVILDAACEEGKFNVVVPFFVESTSTGGGNHPDAMKFDTATEVQAKVFVNMELYNNIVNNGVKNVPEILEKVFQDGAETSTMAITFEKPCDSVAVAADSVGRCQNILMSQNSAKKIEFPNPAYLAPCWDYYIANPASQTTRVVKNDELFCKPLGLLQQ